MVDVRRLLDRDTGVTFTELQRKLVVHDVIHHPESHFRDTCWKFAKLNAVKLVYVDLAQRGHVKL